MALPSYEQQITQAHAGLIRQIVMAIFDPQGRSEAEAAVQQLRQYGETALADRITRILGGERDAALINGLDEDDQVIISAILRGIQNPDTLPNEQGGDPSAAAPGLAHMIHAAATGDTQALQMLSMMAEQMTAAGGDMQQLGGMMRRLVNGERDAELLAANMGPQGESLLLSILSELAKLDSH